MSTATATATATTTSSSTTTLDYLELCRLCLVKERANVPIFEDEGDVRQIFLKIAACLPVKVSRDDKLPKKICDDCVYKVELFYQFWNTTANAEKQLLEWLGDVGGLEDKEFDVLDTNVMKQEGRDNRLDGSVMQISGHQNNMEIGIIDNMSIIQMPDGSEQFTAVPMDASTTIQVVGSSTQVTHDQSQVAHIEEVESEIEDNSDDGCDNEEGLPVKEETEEEQASRAMETQFVTISGDQAGPSGLQQQKMKETQRNADDPKTQSPTKSPRKNRPVKRDLTPMITKKQQQMQKLEIRNQLPKKRKLEQDDNYETPKIFLASDLDPIGDSEYQSKIKLNDSNLPKGANTRIYVTKNENEIVDIFGFNSNNQNIKSIDDTVPENLEVVPDIQYQDDIIMCCKQSPKSEPEDLPFSVFCKICNQFFSTQSEFDKHLYAKHRPKVFKQYDCAHCKKSFIKASRIIKHLRKHRYSMIEHKCEQCNKSFSRKASYNKHKTFHCKPPVSCPKCQKVFRHQRDLNRHEKTHYKPGFSCDKCDYESTIHSAFLVHVKSHADEETKYPFKCTECDKKFTKMSYLQEHFNIHSGEKPFACEFCSEMFSLKSQLSYHCKKYHPECMPKDNTTVKCDTCNQTLKSQRALLRHQKLHIDPKLHLCDICGKNLTSYEHLQRHVRIHTGEKPYVCDICGKAFSDPGNLKGHRRIHTKEKPFQCEFCPKAFNQRSTLTIHRRSHTGERPYVCQLCQKGFSCQSYLTAHRKTACIQ